MRVNINFFIYMLIMSALILAVGVFQLPISDRVLVVFNVLSAIILIFLRYWK